MQLAEQYRRQQAWRAWPSIFAALPPLADQLVLDLGCSIGDQAAELARRGARVIGVDANPELLDVARARGLERVEFRCADLRDLSGLDVIADGIWSSFTAAYFVDLPATLRAWSALLRPGGFIALTEIDDLFGHEPLSERTRELLQAYTDDARAAGRYDFHMGHKLASHLTSAGFVVTQHLTVPDRELAFDGPAEPEVREAWRARFERMSLLRSSWGDAYERVRDEFLRALADPHHRSRASVHVCLAVRP
jgi:SAM-dependent methyltransferase